MRNYANKKMPWLLMLILLFSSCASQPPPRPDWPPEQKAIHLHLYSDSQLNLHRGVPHTLLVCVYQLRSPNVFDQLADDASGITQLLECSLFDASVARSKRFIVHPGQDLIQDLDRAEGAKYVAVVAGYYQPPLQKERVVRRFEVPVIEESKGLLKRSKVLKPAPLNIELTLGPKQIHSGEGK